MKLYRNTLIVALVVSALSCQAETQEEVFINEIKQVATANSVEVQLPVFQKIGATYGADPHKVPSTVKAALVTFMEDTAKGSGPINKEDRPRGMHGNISNSDDIPLSIAMMLVDYKTTGAADAYVALSKNAKIPRSIRDRCIGVLRQYTDDARLQQIATDLIQKTEIHDKQVAILAFAAMKKPTSEGKQFIMGQVENPTLNIEENIVALLARADMSKEAVDLSINIMKTKPATVSSLMPSVSDANPNALKGHSADFKIIAERAADPAAKAAAQKALSKLD